MLVSVLRACHPARMGKKRGILLAVLVVALAGGLVWMLSRTAEPTYQGKSMRAWLKDFYYGWNGDTNEAAFVAFREMGILPTCSYSPTRWSSARFLGQGACRARSVWRSVSSLPIAQAS